MADEWIADRKRRTVDVIDRARDQQHGQRAALDFSDSCGGWYRHGHFFPLKVVVLSRWTKRVFVSVPDQLGSRLLRQQAKRMKLLAKRQAGVLLVARKMLGAIDL